MLNLFFGPAVNAARAISYQIQGAINNFSANFQTALNPQIIKNYATLNLQRVYELVILSMKVSFSLVYILMVPILINIDWILNIWLEKVPQNSNKFVIFIGLSSIFLGMSNPLSVVAEAANRLKFYNLVTMPFYLSTIPLAYLSLYLGNSACSVFIITCLAEGIGFFIKLFIAYKIAAVPVKEIVIQFFHSLVCLLMAVSLGFCVKSFLPNGNLYSFCSVGICFIFAISAVFVVMLNKSERKNIINKILKNEKK